MEIDIFEYQRRVTELFRSGRASDGQYAEMARAVLIAAELDNSVPKIDIGIGLEDNDVQS